MNSLVRTGIPAMAIACLMASSPRALAQSAVDVQWTNTVKAIANASSITKNGTCGTCADAGGTSVQAIASGDGYAEFTPVAGARLYAGLGTSVDASTDPALIDFAFSFWPDGGWDVRERNQYKTEGRVAAGDTFRVAIVAGVVTYYQNTTVVYRSAVAPGYPLVLDTTLIGADAALTSAATTGAGPAPEVPPATPVTVTTTAMASTRIGDLYAATLAATGGGGTYTWTTAGGSLPQGLSLSSAGLISGTATSSGRFSVTARAADAADGTNADDQVLALTVLAARPPSSYDAITDRAARAKPPLPGIGGAGSTFADPTFGTRLMRVTDRATRTASLDLSYRTPSATHSNAWSVDGRYFYVTSTDGTGVPFSFDPTTMQAARLPSTTGDGLALRFFNEATFSYVTPGVLYGTFSGGNLHSVDQFDLASGVYTSLINFDTLAPNLAGTYTGGLGASGGAVERVMAFFGGTSQDRHYYLVVFDKDNPSNHHLVDTLASTVDGVPTTIPLNFSIHAAAIDRSGRYVTVYPTSVDLQAPRSAAPAYVWDLELNTFTATPLVATRSGGHDAYGYGYRVNQDCCTASTWDAAQWQFRSLAAPLVTADLIAPVLLPKEVFLADHPSWHQAQPVALVPFIDATYRYGTNTTAWRAWDDEVIAVETEAAGTGAAVWRFAHHRSNVANDGDPTRISFWYTPRANVSPDGRWALFTSNWEKTLGTDPRGEAGGTFRQDVFLIELARTAATPDPTPDPPPAPEPPQADPVAITTTQLPEGRRNVAYTAAIGHTGGTTPLTWSIAAGSLPPGLALDLSSGTIAGAPRANGTWSFTIRVIDSATPATSATQALTLRIRRR